MAEHCGLVAVVGAPNAGKSTLLNRLTGAKLSIVSPKAQTTRFRVLGILMRGPAQILLVDTPGIFRPRRKLDRAMVKAAWTGAGDADIVALLVDASLERINKDTRAILGNLAETGRPAMLILNKIDATQPSRLLALAAELNAAYAFTDTFMVSARTGNGLEDLRKVFAERIPAGPNGATR